MKALQLLQENNDFSTEILYFLEKHENCDIYLSL